MIVDIITASSPYTREERNPASYLNCYHVDKGHALRNDCKIDQQCQRLWERIQHLREDGINCVDEIPGFERSATLEAAALKVLEGDLYMGPGDYSLLEVIL